MMRIKLPDGSSLEVSKILDIGDILDVNNRKKMFCFTINLKDGSLLNIQNSYKDANKRRIKEITTDLHSKIKMSLVANG